MSKDRSTCGARPSNVSAVDVKDITQVLQFHTCSVTVSAAVPLCTTRQVYNRARVFTAEVDLSQQDCDFERDFLGADGALENATIGVMRCSSDSAAADVCDSAARGPNVDGSGVAGNSIIVASSSSGAGFGVLRHHLYDLDRNKSYCVFYQLENPHCK